MTYEEILAPYRDLPVPFDALYTDAESFRQQDSPLAFLDLTPDQQEVLLNWCRQFRKIKTFYRYRSSYGLKHSFGHGENGFYVYNGAFKGAMIIAGFKPKTTDTLNWHFNISGRDVNKMMERGRKRNRYR